MKKKPLFGIISAWFYLHSASKLRHTACVSYNVLFVFCLAWAGWCSLLTHCSLLVFVLNPFKSISAIKISSALIRKITKSFDVCKGDCSSIFRYIWVLYMFYHKLVYIRYTKFFILPLTGSYWYIEQNLNRILSKILYRLP